MNGEREGLDQRTGLMEIMDLGTGKRVAVVRIYAAPRDAGLEGDAGDVYFKVFAINATRLEIAIENERLQRFAYEIDSGTVRRID